MSIDAMNEKVKELRKLKRMQEELTAEIEAIQDELKAHMNTHGIAAALFHLRRQRRAAPATLIIRAQGVVRRRQLRPARVNGHYIYYL